MAEPPKIPLFKPNKEEAKIIIHANKEFMKRYVSGILIGLGSAYFLLRSTRTQTRTARGFGAYFVLGLTGEYIGRVIGVARAMEELKRLPPDSPLKEFVDKISNREPIGTHNLPGSTITLIPPNQISSFPRTNEDFSFKPKRKNEYGDDIE